MTPPDRPKRIALLGATGSIGASTLRVLAAHPDKLELVAIAAHSRHADLAAIARTHPSVRHVALFTPDALAQARASAAFPPSVQFHPAGPDGLSSLATLPEVDLVLIAVVGTTGLAPALACLHAGKTLALASKEILVLAGDFIMAAARASGTPLLPVDSEHNALFQCLEGRPPDSIRRVLLTASGGAFRDWPPERLAHATPADALKHPNWSMGPKITVDSATLANKGLELIEARHLFGLRPAQCQAVIHPQSIVHALAEFTDGSTLAQLCPPSMTFPIQHALLHPLRVPGPDSSLAFDHPFSLDFRPADESRFPMLRLARQAMETAGAAPALYNAANEVAVAAFLAGHLPFLAIPSLVEQVLSRLPTTAPPDLPTILAADTEARLLAHSLLPSLQPR